MRSHSILVLVIIAFLASADADAKYSGGMGEPNDPYIIATAEDLNDIGNHQEDWNKHFILTNDVNLAQYTGTKFNIIGTSTMKFIGVFDGNGHKVWSFTWSSTGRDYIGLFGYVSLVGQIRNLGMENVDVNAVNGNYVGGLCGENNGTISGCYATGSVTGGDDSLDVGGLCGENNGTISGCYAMGSVTGGDDYWGVGSLCGENYGMISSCYATGSVSGGVDSQCLGGLCGQNNGTIRGCYATGIVTGTYCLGGLVGTNNSGIISNCYSTGNVNSDYYEVGGLVGYNSGIISNCYSTGSVNGTGSDVGGLVGCNDWDSSLLNCYFTGSVNGDYWVGGLTGRNYGNVSNCYSTGSVNGTGSDVGGLVGYNPGSVSNCYSTGVVNGVEYVGGLVGDNGYSGVVSNCYSTGDVSGRSDVGGLVGCNYYGSISNCYSNGSVSGDHNVGGLVGEGDANHVCSSVWDIETSGQTTSAGGTGKTTAEMQDMQTYVDAGWDFIPKGVWAEPEGGGYPVLWWQLPPLIGKPGFSGGTGEPGNPFLLSTALELSSIGSDPRLIGAHFKLLNPIDLAGMDFLMIGSELFPFTGVFDGNDHTISNLTYDCNGWDNIGLFGYVDGPNAEIIDLGLIDPNINAGTGNYVGSLVGYLRDGTIANCYAEGGSVSGEAYVGGLVAVSGGTINKCYANGVVTGVWAVGGLVGGNWDGSVSNCYSNGSVSGYQGVGGLVGWNESGSISNCHSTGGVNGDFNVGGLVGENYEGSILNCYSTGDVIGDWSVGGLVGDNTFGGIVSNCYSTGNLSGNGAVGGLVGCNDGSVSDCYSIGDVNGVSDVGGLVGANDGTIQDCYSKGNVDADYLVGGLVGYNSCYAAITNCYCTGFINGNYAVGGLVGWNPVYCDDYGCWQGTISQSFWDIKTSGISYCAGGTGKTTTSMKTQSTFTDAGWDFVGETVNGPNDVWRMCLDGVEYPLLSWQFVPDFVCPDGVDILDLAFFVDIWLSECDETNNFCNNTDINYDELVNFFDFAVFASHWLEGQ